MDLKLITKFGKWKKIIRGEKNKKRNFPLVFLFFVLFYFCLFVFCQSKVSGPSATKSLERFGKCRLLGPTKGPLNLGTISRDTILCT